MLLSIMIICAFISYKSTRQERYEDVVTSNTCTDLITDYLLQTDFKGNTRVNVLQNIKNELGISKEELLERHNIKMSDLPDRVKEKLPNVSLDEVLSNFKRSIVIEQDKEAPQNSCIIPVSYIKRLRDVTNAPDVMIQNFNEYNTGDQERIRQSNIDPSIQKKVCMIGDMFYPSNIVTKHSNDFGQLVEVEKTSRDKEKVEYLGCEFPVLRGMGSIKGDLKKIFERSDSENLRKFNELIDEFNVSNDRRLVAASKDASTAKEESTTHGNMVTQQTIAANAKDILDKQIAATETTVPPMTSAYIANTDAKNKLSKDIQARSGYVGISTRNYIV
jgi:hypothetical protein